MYKLRFQLLALLACCAPIAVSAKALDRRKDAAHRLHQPETGGIVFVNGRLVSADELATHSVQEHYSAALTAIEEQDWKEARTQLRIITVNFPQSAYVSEAHFLLGKVYVEQGEYDLADQELAHYLRDQQDLSHIEEAAELRLEVAEALASGVRTHLFGRSWLPRLFSSRSSAIEVLDEIIAFLPGHPLAARALLTKATVQAKDGYAEEAVASYQTLLRRFPQHDLAAQAYLGIAQTYSEQAKIESNNPDILALVEINVRRFKAEMPGNSLIPEADEALRQVRELYANALYETGKFYTRIGHPRASAIYYLRAINQFPNTEVASKCRMKLDPLSKVVAELKLGSDPDSAA